MLETFSQDSFRVVHSAIREANDLHAEQIECEHILLGLLQLRGGEPARVLEAEGIDLVAARAELVRIVGRGSSSSSAKWSPAVRRVLDGARKAASIDGDDKVEPSHLLEALLSETSGAHLDILRALRHHSN